MLKRNFVQCEFDGKMYDADKTIISFATPRRGRALEN